MIQYVKFRGTPAYENNLLPSFNLVSRGKECRSCRAYSKKTDRKHVNSACYIVELPTSHTTEYGFSSGHLYIYLTFLLKYFSNFSRARMMHCSHWFGRLLSILMTSNAPSRLSPVCILYTHKCFFQYYIAGMDQHKVRAPTPVLPVAPLQVRCESARKRCT